MFSQIIADFNTNPDIGQGPGGGAIQTLISYLAGVALAFCVVAWVSAGALVAVGSFGDNYRASSMGKRVFVAAAGGSFLVGAAGALNHFLFHIGQIFN